MGFSDKCEVRDTRVKDETPSLGLSIGRMELLLTKMWEEDKQSGVSWEPGEERASRKRN